MVATPHRIVNFTVQSGLVHTFCRLAALFAAIVVAIGVWIDCEYRAWRSQNIAFQAGQSKYFDATWDHSPEGDDLDLSAFFLQTKGILRNAYPSPPILPRWITGNDRIGDNVIAVNLFRDGDPKVLLQFPCVQYVAIDQLNAESLDVLQKLSRLETLVIALPIEPGADMHRLKNLTQLKRLEVRGENISDDVLQTIAGLNGLESLSISNGRRDFPPISLPRLNRLKNLRRLELGGLQFVGGDLSSLAELTKIESLDIDTWNISEDSLTAISRLRNLRELKLSSHLTATGINGLHGLSPACSLELSGLQIAGDEGARCVGAIRNLRKLKLSGVSDVGLAYVRRLQSLEELDLSNTNISHRGLANLEGLSKLKLLNLSGCNISGSGTISLARLSSLEEVNLENAKFRTSDLRGLQSLRNLTDLNLAGTLVGDGGFQRSFACVKLKNLSLAATCITDQGLCGLRQFSKLERLDLSRTRVFGTGFELFESLPMLAELDLSHSWATGVGFEYLAKCRGLSELNLDTTPLFVKPFSSFNNSGVGNRINLNLSKTRIRDEDLSDIAQFAADRLNLQDTHVTDRGVKHLRRCTNVSSINLRNTLVTDESIVSIAAIADLQSVNLQRTRVTTAGIARLRAMRPDLGIEYEETEFGPMPGSETIVKREARKHDFETGRSEVVAE